MKLQSRFLRTALMTILLGGMLALTSNPARAAGPCFVNGAASGLNNGTDWADAYTSLQSALADPCTEIWVAAGTYTPAASDRTLSFVLEDGTAIYGGFAGTETLRSQRDWKAHVTTLSGDLNHDDSGFTNNTENSYHVVFSTGVSSSAMLDGFTISGGNANGGGLYDNYGGGVESINSDSPTLANLTFSGNSAYGSGGGMYSYYLGSPTLTNVTFSGNTVGGGGGGLGISTSTPTLTNVTFSSNSAGQGGGIFNFYLAPVLTNVTFSGNSASNGGGLFNSQGHPALTNVTFSGNTAIGSGGGIYNDLNGGTLTLNNVIIAGSPSGGDCVLASGSLTGASSNNLVQDASNACGLTNASNGNITGADPLLSALADHGGATQTMLIGAASPAIDAGTNTGCTTPDQRGLSRPQNGTCDIGAVERDVTIPTVDSFTMPASATSLSVSINAFTASDNVSVAGYLATESATPPSPGAAGWTALAPSSFTVAATGNRTIYPWVKDGDDNVSTASTPATVSVCLGGPVTVTSSADSGAGTLRQAINDICAGDTIVFNSLLSGATIHLASTLAIAKNLTIDGSALASKITISGENTVRVFQTTGHNLVTVGLDGLIVTKGVASGAGQAGQGGGLLNDAITTITNSIFDSNTANSGGAISTYGGLTIIDSTFSGNSSTDISTGGGAILNSYILTITGSTFSGNSANASGGSGGAIFNVAPGEIYNSTFSGNSAAVGGAVLTTQPLTIKNSTISGNAASQGGGIDIDSHTTILNNTIIANSTGGDCLNNGTFGSNTNNLIQDGSCSPSLSGDPHLGALANNGGQTKTLALLAGSKAIDAGDNTTCAAAPVNNLDQRGTARPNGAHCDIGAYEYVDTTAPSVTAFTATSPSTSLNVPIPTFTAADDGALAGYLITLSATPPAANAAGWTATAPTTYTVVSDGSYTLYPWVKDGASHVSQVYGSPASVSVDATVPTVVSILRANPSPTNLASVTFTVTFSESVIGVDTADFSLTTTGISGASVTSVSGSGSTRTVIVNTGTGNGTLRLDIPVSATITDPSGNAISNRPYSAGETYTVSKTLTFTSAAAQDGWVLEKSELSSMGGTIDAGATTFRLGDDTSRKQYRSILSFNTGASLPDTAVITGVTLKLMKQSISGGSDPVSTFLGFMVDVKNGFFGTSALLQTGDFQASFTPATGKTYGPFKPAPVSNWYSINLAGAKGYVNKLAANSGLTQIRLRFALDDNGDKIANYLSLYSGNATPASRRPQLVITYYVP